MKSSLCRRCVAGVIKNTFRISHRQISVTSSACLSHSKQQLSKEDDSDWMSYAKNYDGKGNPFPKISRELLTFTGDEIKSEFKLNLRSRSNEFSGEISEAFIDPKVQEILKKLTGMNLDKVFQMRKEELSIPSYQLLSEGDYSKSVSTIKKDAMQRLRMPKVRARRKPIDVVLSKDDNIQEHDEDKANFVFTDISTTVNHRNRRIVVRENDSGILREASWDERDRMQFMYFPKESQTHELVPVLQDEHMQNAFDRGMHEQLLDMINIQCESDAPDYIRVHQQVYEDIDHNQSYDILHSTRHYGGLIFYLVNNKRTNKLLNHLILQTRIEEAIDLVKLHHLIHSESHQDNTESHQDNTDDMQILKSYLENEQLTNSLQILEELQKENKTQAQHS